MRFIQKSLIATLLTLAPAVEGTGSGIATEGTAPAGFDNKFFNLDGTIVSTRATPTIGGPPVKEHYVTKIAYCADATTLNINSIRLDMTNGIDGSLTAGTAHDPLGLIAGGDASCKEVDITKYKCFRKAELFTDAAGTYVTSMTLTDSDGTAHKLDGGDATEVSLTSVDFGTDGCLSAYDLWFDAGAGPD